MATATTHQPSPIIRSCHHCGRTSSSLLRCAQCKSAYYCNRSCQSAAWHPKQSDDDHDGGGSSMGHRSVCRRLRQRAELAAAQNTALNDCNDTGNANDNDNAAVATEAWRDLARQVESMDRDEAYRQMCRAQDEIRRLQSYCQERNQTENDLSMVESPIMMSHSINSEAEHEKSTEGGLSRDVFTSVTNSDVQLLQRANEQSTTALQTNKRVHLINGTWIDNGGECSIEFLPNVKCYILTLTQNNTSESTSRSCIPNRDGLTLDFSLIHDNSKDYSSSEISYYEVKMYHDKETSNDPLLSLSLPVDSFSLGIDQEQAPNYRVTTDDNSLSVRIQFHSDSLDENTSITDELLGNTDTTSTFSSTMTSDAKSMNYLCCRTCHNPIVDNDVGKNDGQPVIRSVLPLPSGYWDEITDYLICYDGQPTVDFNSSLTNAISGSVLEDDAILILHQLDLRKEGGVCELNIHGYGENSSKDTDISDLNFAETGNTQPWKDKSWRVDTQIKAIACAICCSTLGFVSSHDTNTYRFYKHLLSCFPNNINANPKNDILCSYTCGSFLSREMIRYAESEAIYTFIVETEAHTSGCILLRMLSWDTIMGTTAPMATKFNDGNAIEYQKVLKVIFEETSDVNVSLASDNPMEWQWGGLDLCCPPLRKTGFKEPALHNTLSAEMTALNVDAQTKTTSVRIYLSSSEYHQLKHTLVLGSRFFSEAVREAFIMSKLGLTPGSGEQEPAALLSHLPIIGS